MNTQRSWYRGLSKVFEEAVKVILFPNKESAEETSQSTDNSGKKSKSKDKTKKEKECLIQ